MSKVEKFVTATMAIFWVYCIYHFGIGQLVTYPRWEHYVVEGYFLFSAAVFTYIWFRARGSG